MLIIKIIFNELDVLLIETTIKLTPKDLKGIRENKTQKKKES